MSGNTLPPGFLANGSNWTSQPWAWIAIPAGAVFVVAILAAVLYVLRRRRLRRRRADAPLTSPSDPALVEMWDVPRPPRRPRRLLPPPEEGLNDAGEAPPPYCGPYRKTGQSRESVAVMDGAASPPPPALDDDPAPATTTTALPPRPPSPASPSPLLPPPPVYEHAPARNSVMTERLRQDVATAWRFVGAHPAEDGEGAHGAGEARPEQ
ncbi:hypothetical protein P8C59_003036 [Phyllachora maydis]|uniref:Uncharacterized protein n=1 Tax=Phyllachora maydis TaxID=1825666 RepID=A0AAD9I0Y8_9PEZI|nr:hypothetical protein P8C59_003036 [Phyllachora maydis]